MDAARKSRLSNQNKKRWAECAEIAEKIGLTKHQVHNYLYIELANEEKLNAAKSGDPATLEWLKTTRGWQRLQDDLNAPPLKVHEPKKGDLAETPEEQIRVAMWLIRKIGSVEQAKIAFNIACEALNKLEAKSVKDS